MMPPIHRPILTGRADCFFPDGTFVQIPCGPGDPDIRIRLILLLANQQNPGEEVIEIDDGIIIALLMPPHLLLRAT